jgi:hypothetical protein
VRHGLEPSFVLEDAEQCMAGSFSSAHELDYVIYGSTKMLSHLNASFVDRVSDPALNQNTNCNDI